MKLQKTAIALSMLATMAQVHGQTVAPTPITYLPYNITAPGSYYLATDLVATNENGISITQPATGNITLDMRGHKITQSGSNTEFWAIQVRGGPIYNGAGALPEKGSVLIENGTLSGFPYAILDELANHVTINNLTFNSISTGHGQALQVVFSQNTTVENCFFTGPTDCGIYERNDVPVTHNAFINNKFSNQFIQFGLVGQNILIDGSNNSNSVPMATVISRVEN